MSWLVWEPVFPRDPIMMDLVFSLHVPFNPRAGQSARQGLDSRPLVPYLKKRNQQPKPWGCCQHTSS